MTMPEPEPQREVLRIVTYNVHACRGVDGVEDVERIAEVLRELDPDVVALQEICWGPKHEIDQLGRIARWLGMAATVAATMRRDEGWYGNAIISRMEAREHMRFDLGGPGEPRCALRVDFGSGEPALCVVTTHLGLTVPGRRAQMGRLEAVLDAVAVRPLVVLGDFNAWVPVRDVVRRLTRRFGRQRCGRTFPSSRPLFALDRIWVAPVDALVSSRVHRSPLARTASDHLPLVAEVRGPRSRPFADVDGARPTGRRTFDAGC